MSRLILFKTEDTSTAGWENRTLHTGALTDILAQHFDYSNKPAPDAGYRLIEFKRDENEASFDHSGGSTHQRLSPWRVTRIEEYPANTGLESFDEIIIAYCEHAPLPEAENSWQELKPARVTIDSFGGDEQAYQRWQAVQKISV